LGWILAPFVLVVSLLSQELQHTWPKIGLWLLVYVLYQFVLEILGKYVKRAYEAPFFRMGRIQIMVIMGGALVFLTGGAPSYFWFVFLWPLLASSLYFRKWITTWIVYGEAIAFYFIVSWLAKSAVTGTDLAFWLVNSVLMLLLTIVFRYLIENIQMYREAEHVLRLDTALGLDEALNTILRQAVDLVGAKDGSLMLVDDTGELGFRARVGGLFPPGKTPRTLKVGGGIAGRVAQTREPYICRDAERDPNFAPIVEGVPIRSLVSVPIISHDVLIGVINVDSEWPDYFSQVDVDLLAKLADQVGVAIERAQLLESLRTIGESAVAGSQDVEKQIVATVHRFTACPVALWQVEGTQARIKAHWGLRQEYVQKRILDLEHSATGKAIRTGDMVEVSSIEDDPDVSQITKEEAKLQGWRSMLLVPLWAGPGRAVGTLSIYTLAKKKFTPWECDLLRVFAGQAGIVIQNTERLRVVEQLNKIGQTLTTLQASPEILDRTLRQIAETAQEILGADTVDLYEYEVSRDMFVLPPIMVGERRSPGLVPESISEDDIVFKIARSGEAIYTSDAQHDPVLAGDWETRRTGVSEQRFVIREEVVSSAGLPLRVGTQVVGVLYVSYRQKRNFDFELRSRIEVFASQAAIALQNARLLVSEQRQVQQLGKLHQVLGVAMRTLSPERVLPLLVSSVNDILGPEASSVINLYDPIKEEFQSQCAAGPAKAFLEQGSPRKEGGASITVVRSKKPLFIDDAVTHPLRRPESVGEGIKSFACLPLYVGTEVLGTLYVRFDGKPHCFLEDEQKVLELFASSAAVAIKNANLFRQIIAERLERAKAIKEIGFGITAGLGLSLHTTLNDLLGKTLRLMKDASVGEIWLLDEAGKLRVQAVQGNTQAEAKQQLDMGEGIVGWVAQSKRSYATGNVKDDSHFVRRLVGTQAELTVPLIQKDRLIGVLNVEHPLPAAFGVEDVLLLETIASQVVIAIESARLYEQLAEKNQQLDYLLNRKIRDLQAVYKVSQQLTSAVRLNEQDVLNLIHEQTSELMDTKNMYIALYDEATDIVRFPLMYVDGQPTQVPSRSGGKGRTERIIQNRRPILIETRAESVKWYDEYGKEYIGEPFASWIGVPMMAGDKVLGVIATYHKTEDYVYTKDDLEVLSLMASQAAIVLQNARMWEAMQKLSEDLSAGALLDVA
jgi:GAF domain-containing protein